MYKRILVPVDGSHTSNQALAASLQLAKDFGSRIRLIHVINELTGLGGFYQSGGYPGDLRDVLPENGTRILDEAMARTRTSGLEAGRVLAEGFNLRLGEAVVDAANHWMADLIVIGTHGRRGIGRMLLGSGAEQIIRLAPVPVLVVRSKTQENAAAKAGA